MLVKDFAYHIKLKKKKILHIKPSDYHALNIYILRYMLKDKVALHL